MKIRNRTLIRILSKMVAATSRVLFRVSRVHVIEAEPQISPYAPTKERYIYCVWHDGMLGALFSGKVHGMAALTSRHVDGNYVADVMEALGIRPVRGSHNHGGAAAMKQLMDETHDVNITITPDGPRGPRRKIKPGILFLASHTGRPIVPVAFSCVHAWKPQGKWTDLVIPKPGTDAYSLGGTPMRVPEGLTRQDLLKYCTELQHRMDMLQLQADQLAGHAPLSESSDRARAA